MRINRKLVKGEKKVRRQETVRRGIMKPRPISVPNVPIAPGGSSDFTKVKNFISNKTNYPPVVSCIIRDRLGNNLFNIAATIGLAIDNKCIPIFENWAYAEFFDWDLTFDSELEQSIPWSVYVESQFAYNPIPYVENIKINGHFQSYKYFPESVILNKFKMKKEVEDYIRNKYDSLLKQRTTSIHVRRGDYVNNHSYCQVGMDYYKNSIQLLDKDTDRFLVFSDDIEWCKKAYNFPRTTFIEGECDYIDLFLMTKCANNIVTNSTFSWWGAYLNKHNGKKIIAPSKWFSRGLSRHNSGDLIPESWTKLNPERVWTKM